MKLDVTVLILGSSDSEYLGDTLDALASSIAQPSYLRLVLRDEGEVELPSNLDIDTEIVRTDASTTGAAFEEAREGVSTRWIWLLHDDSAPLPETLGVLMDALVGSKAIDAAGPKQVGWEDPTELLEVGINATGSGRRVPELDPGEKDQGQFDTREDVLAVGTAGMLVRTSALEDVGGFDPGLGPFGDGLELSRRLQAAGGRVIVVPKAKIRHARRSYRNTAASFGARRSSQVYNALVAASALAFPFLVLGYLLLAPLRALARLLTKDTVRAGGELRSGARIIGALPAVFRARKRLSSVSTTSAYRSLEATGRDVARGKSDIRKAAKEAIELEGRPTQERREDLESLRARTRSAAALLAVGSLAIGIASLLPHLSSLGVTGGAILPDSTSVSDLVSRWFSTWVPVGDGYPGYLEPLWALAIPIVWVASWFGWTLTEIAFVVLLLAPFFAAMSAFKASGEVANSPVVRFIAGTLWAASPALLSSISVGSLASVIFHVVLPLFLAGCARVVRTGRSSSVGASAWWALVLVAAYPASFIGVATVAVLIAVLTRRGAGLWVMFPAGAWSAPALWELAKSLPASLVALPGVPFDYSPGSLLEVVAGWPLGFSGNDQVRLALTVLIGALVIGSVLVALRPRIGVAIGFLAVTLGALLVSLSLSTTVGTTASGVEALAWPGPGTSLIWGGLVLAVTVGAHGLRHALTERSFSIWHVATGLVTLALFALPVGSAVSWGIGVHRGAPTHLLADRQQSLTPALAERNASSSDRSRVLVLDPGPTETRVSLWRGDGPQLTDNTTSVHLSGQARAASEDLAAALPLVGTPGFAEHVAAHGVAVIIVREDDAAARELATQLTATDNLSRVTTSEVGTFWRLDEHVGRASLDGQALPASLVDLDGTTGGGRLDLAERADPRWRATVEGQEIAPTLDGWNQSWTVPAGELHVTHAGIFAQWWMHAFRIVIVGANLIVCLPLRRAR